MSHKSVRRKACELRTPRSRRPRRSIDSRLVLYRTRSRVYRICSFCGSSDSESVLHVESSQNVVVCEISSLYLFVNLILVPVPPVPTHLFFHPSLLPFVSPLCSSTTPSLFHSRLKTYLFHFFLPDCLHVLLPGPFLLSYLFFYFSRIFSSLGRALD